jgi:signal transduction histidine kinase
LAARVALVALSFFGGLGIAIYVGGWLFLPPEGSDKAIFWDARADHRTVALVAAAASVLGALMVVAGLLGAPALLGSVSPGLVSVAALVAVWRHADRGDRLAVERLVTLLSAPGPASAPAQPSAGRRLVIPLLRFLVGAGLIVLGTSTLLAPKHLNDTDIVVAFAAVGVVAGVSLILAPWWLRLGRELAAERRQRARAEEHVEMAAHLHDSVLQTLALIQRNAQDPQQVQRLARAQERQLRSWLFDRASAEHPPVVGAGPDEPCTLGTAVLAMQQAVEADHGIRVEVVTVGDCDLDEGLRALVAATREAVVNAAKWSGADMVSVYAEVEGDAVSVFVRDRGRGFDPEAVAADRRGISESIHGRIERHGGTSTVRSSPDQGTEVSLRVPRKAQS